MSEHGFHVHGPHDHAVEHASQHGGDGFSNKIAVMTAILATMGALFGYMGGATQNDAALFKSNAAIDKTAASDQWNFYQAKSNRQNLADLASSLPGVDQAKYKAKIAHYDADKAKIKLEAEKLEASSEQWNEKSAHALHTHHQWALATTAEQIAISLAAITLLTRRRWLLSVTYVVAVLGFALGAFAWLNVDPIGSLMSGGGETVHAARAN
jgi:cytochrome c556